MVMQETSSENCTFICQPLQSLQEFEVDNTKKYAQLILNFIWVVYETLKCCNFTFLIHRYPITTDLFFSNLSHIYFENNLLLI